MSDSADYTFVCPECAESMLVNGSMCDTPLGNGCVVCSAALTTDVFSATWARACDRAVTGSADITRLDSPERAEK